MKIENERLTVEIIDRALELEPGSELCLLCDDGIERNTLYCELIRSRLGLIRDSWMAECETVIIERNQRDGRNAIVLKKMKIPSAYIRKLDGSRAEVTLCGDESE